MTQKENSQEKEGLLDRIAGGIAGPENPREFSGVGGWLLFFAITLIITVIYLVGDILFNLDSLGGFSLFHIPVFVQIAIIVLFARSIYYLFKEDRRGVEMIKWAIWLPLGNAVLLFTLFWVFELPGIEEVYTSIFQSLVYASIWSLYLSKSKRVHNTYYKK